MSEKLNGGAELTPGVQAQGLSLYSPKASVPTTLRVPRPGSTAPAQLMQGVARMPVRASLFQLLVRFHAVATHYGLHRLGQQFPRFVQVGAIRSSLISILRRPRRHDS